MRIWKKFIMPIFVLTFLISCSSGSNDITIKNKTFASNLFVQKVENSTSSEELTKNISNKEKIEQVFQMVDGLEVEEKQREDVFEMMNSDDLYTFVFTDKNKFETGKEPPYAFYALEDGTFLFTHEGLNSVRKKPVVTTEKHKDLLQEIMQHFDVDF